ncbi:MAG TPA: ATP-binding protein [Streptosporangiaceae bacterium]|nr:ATP-binding protein [Streptosporangiaceae bacterium]
MSHSGEPAADVEFCLVFPRESLSVPVMRRVLGDTLSRLGIDETCVDDLLLAVTEACTNVLRHAGPGRRYELVAHVGTQRCVLEVLDSGRGFDPAKVGRARRRHVGLRRSVRPMGMLRRNKTAPAHAAPSSPATLRNRITRSRQLARERAIADLPESGRGLAIMRACVDDVTMRSRPGQGTVVSLQKRIEWRTDAPLALRPPPQLKDVG